MNILQFKKEYQAFKKNDKVFSLYCWFEKYGFWFYAALTSALGFWAWNNMGFVPQSALQGEELEQAQNALNTIGVMKMVNFLVWMQIPFLLPTLGLSFWAKKRLKAALHLSADFKLFNFTRPATENDKKMVVQALLNLQGSVWNKEIQDLQECINDPKLPHAWWEILNQYLTTELKHQVQAHPDHVAQSENGKRLTVAVEQLDQRIGRLKHSSLNV